MNKSTTCHRKLPRVNRAERARLEEQINSLTAQRKLRVKLKGRLERSSGDNVQGGLKKQVKKATDEYKEEEVNKQQLPEVKGRREVGNSSAGPRLEKPPCEVVARLRYFESEVSAVLEDAKRGGLTASAQPPVLQAAMRLAGSSRAMASTMESPGSEGDETTEEGTEEGTEKGESSRKAGHRSSSSSSPSPSSPPSPPLPRDKCAEEKEKIRALIHVLAETDKKHRQLEKEAHRLEVLNSALLRKLDALELHCGATAFEPRSDFTVVEASPTPDEEDVSEELKQKIEDCKKRARELERALEAQQEENKELVDLDKQHGIWFTGLLEEGGSNEVLDGLEKTRKECAKLTRDIDIRTKELEMLLEEKALSPDELKEREGGAWKEDHSRQIEDLITKGGGFLDCKGVKDELGRVHEAMEKLRKENNFLRAGLKSVIPKARPGGEDDELEQEIANLNSLLAASESRRSEAAPELESTTFRLKKELNEAVAAAAAAKSKRIVYLTSRALMLKAQIADAQSTTDRTRIASLTSRIAAVEARIAEAPTAPDFALLSTLQTERLRLSPSLELHKLVEGLVVEATPAIIDLPDSYFQRAWEDLFGRVQIWCYNYYRAREDSLNPKYHDLVNSSHLLAFYLRDVLIHRDYVERLIPWNSSEQGRVDVATGIVFKILVEEVFEPIRFLLHLRFPDPSERWKKRPQYKSAFEAKGMASDAVRPRFQACESFLERKRKRAEGKHPEHEVFESGPRSRKRVKNSRDHFNFFRMFEDGEQQGVKRDNDADVLLNTSRAKLMRSIFSLADDSTSLKSRILRADVCELIADTLRPLAVICTSVDQTIITDTTWEDDPGPHKEQLWKIVKAAYDLAIEMRTQRTIIHPVCTDLMSMRPFDASSMTIANHPPSTGPRRREEIEKLYDARSQRLMGGPGTSGVGCHLRPVCEVLPCLLRRGNPASGKYSWADRQVVSKAKVYVGGPDDATLQDGLIYTVHESPYGL